MITIEGQEWITDRQIGARQLVWLTLRELREDEPRATCLAVWNGRGSFFDALNLAEIALSRVVAWKPISHPSPHYGEDIDWATAKTPMEMEDADRGDGELVIIEDDRLVGDWI